MSKKRYKLTEEQKKQRSNKMKMVHRLDPSLRLRTRHRGVY